MDVIRWLIENTVSIMSHFDTAKLLSDYQIDEALGLSLEDYADTSEVEFEWIGEFQILAQNYWNNLYP